MFFLGGTVATGATVGFGVFVLLMSAFAFDSPQRETDPELVFRILSVGIGLVGLGLWAICGAVLVPRKWWVIAMVGVVIASLGALLTVIALGLAVGGG